MDYEQLYNDALEEIAELQRELREAYSEIRNLSNELSNSGRTDWEY